MLPQDHIVMHYIVRLITYTTNQLLVTFITNQSIVTGFQITRLTIFCFSEIKCTHLHIHVTSCFGNSVKTNFVHAIVQKEKCVPFVLSFTTWLFDLMIETQANYFLYTYEPSFAHSCRML